MKTIIAGSRSYNCFTGLEVAIAECGWKITHVVSGGAIGVDSLGELWAKAENIPVTVRKPNYLLFGRVAPLVRNGEMANESEALIALWDGKSRGTQDMIKKANSQGLKVHIHMV